MTQPYLDVYNPHDLDECELPYVFAFVANPPKAGIFVGVLMSEEGNILDCHARSSLSFLLFDLGISEPKHIETIHKFYPDGYRIEFFGWYAAPTPRFLKALKQSTFQSIKAKIL